MSQLLAGNVSRSDAEHAVTALFSYISKNRAQQNDSELLGSKEQSIWLVVSTKQMSLPKPKIGKPHRIPLSYPLLDPHTHSICLITKDPQRQYKDLLKLKNIISISRVVGVSKLKGKFKPFEARRQLLRDHSVFLADERVIPMLPRLLGKTFLDTKKQPVPVCLTKPNLKLELEKAVSATYMHQHNGTCTSIKIASSSHNCAQILDNLMTAIPSVVANVPGGWENVQSLHIKTSQSVSLPIWSCDLVTGERWKNIVSAKDCKVMALTGKRRRDDTPKGDERMPPEKKVRPPRGTET